MNRHRIRDTRDPRTRDNETLRAQLCLGLRCARSGTGQWRPYADRSRVFIEGE